MTSFENEEEYGTDFLAWLECRDWSPLAPGNLVDYAGSVETAHGVWVVDKQTGDNRYRLSHYYDSGVCLNANRRDLASIPVRRSDPGE